jgi:hypothetical protein
MTDAQSQSINKAQEILGEHFEAFVICYQHGDEKEDNCEISGHVHFGGFNSAVGMLEVTKQKIVQISVQKYIDSKEGEE